ncbi:MAG: GIY-YIG nuclease family protein [Candidatus Berkelbacteria bacterium]|nr:GIY-YIG nuclease family protein [Candidatus Berkelbacteria bacterium]
MFVYIITNYKNNVFYIGVTNNLTRRIYEHKNKLFSNSFSSRYNLYKLIWFEEFNTAIEAITAEKKRDGNEKEKLR